MVIRLLLVGCLAFGGWALTVSQGPEIRYGLMLWGALSVWCGLTMGWILARPRMRLAGSPYRKRLVRLLDLGVAVLPGVLLIAYGALAPAAPSLTQGGFDICDTSPGYCVSGTRAFVHFGLFILVTGVIANWVVGLEPPEKSDRKD